MYKNDHECKIMKAIFNVVLPMRVWYYYYGSISSIHVTIIHVQRLWITNVNHFITNL